MDNAKLQNFTSVVKNAWFVPSPYEFLVFVVLIGLFFLLLVFFHYSGIQRAVKKNSRCYQEKRQTRTDGVYSVTATNGRNEPMYKVSYDIGKKRNVLECACPEGDVSNTFTDINMYNLKTKSVDKVSEKYCNCTTDVYTPGESVYFTGHPGLVRFMSSQDTSFFKR